MLGVGFFLIEDDVVRVSTIEQTMEVRIRECESECRVLVVEVDFVDRQNDATIHEQEEIALVSEAFSNSAWNGASKFGIPYIDLAPTSEIGKVLDVDNSKVVSVTVLLKWCLKIAE